MKHSLVLILICIYSTTGITQQFNTDCITFDSLQPGVNYANDVFPGEIFHSENAYSLRAINLGGHFGLIMADTIFSCLKPELSTNNYIILNGGIGIEIAESKLVNAISASISTNCNRKLLLQINNSPLVSIDTDSSYAQVLNGDLDVTYTSGLLIIEGEVYNLEIGGEEIGIDLICIESIIRDCPIGDLRISPIECTDTSYWFTLDFEVENSPSDSFSIKGLSLLDSTFAYHDLPISLGPFKKVCDSVQFVEVHDQLDTSCARVGTIFDFCCDHCSIKSADIRDVECISDTSVSFYIHVESDFHENDSFIVTGRNGIPVGTFSLKQSLLHVDSMRLSGHDYEFVKICHGQDTSCCYSLEFMAPICEKECQISNIRLEQTPCENDSFYVYLIFDVSNPQAHSFRVKGNGRNEGPFPYSEIPIKLGPYPADCETPYEFAVYDIEDEHCSNHITLGKVCCSENCQIENLSVDFLGCTSDTSYSIRVYFDVKNHRNQGFDIFSRNGFWGYVNRNPDFVLVDFPKSGHTYDLLKICANDNETCCQSIEFESPPCGSSKVTHSLNPEDFLLFLESDKIIVRWSKIPANHRFAIHDISSRQLISGKLRELSTEEYSTGLSNTGIENRPGIYIFTIFTQKNVYSKKLIIP